MAATSSAVRSAGARCRTTSGAPSLPSMEPSGPNRPSLGACGRLGAAARRHALPPLRARRALAAGEGEICQLGECPGVHGALEIDHFLHRLPVSRPAELIELRFAGMGEVEPGIVPFQAQEEPALLLADAHRLLVAPHVARREAIAQPAFGLTEEGHIRLGAPDLFLHL